MDVVIAVVGGTGMAGREVVRALAARGHRVRVMSRRSPASLPAGAEHRRVDLMTGDGLPAAVDCADAVVDAANGGPLRNAAAAVLLDGGRRLLAAERRAGVGHHVAVSIVGVDRFTYGYYGAKHEQEALIRTAPVPWTIVRASQFHSLLAGVFDATARAGVLPGALFPLQPVDAREAAERVADAVEAEPLRDVVELAGPEIAPVSMLARTWRRVTRRHAFVVPVPAAGRAGRALAAGGLTNPEAPRGRLTFEAWLRARHEAPA